MKKKSKKKLRVRKNCFNATIIICNAFTILQNILFHNFLAIKE